MSSAPLLPTAEAAPPELLARWDALGFRPATRLGWALEHAALQRPEALAVVDERERVSFTELARRSQAIARQLLESGVRPGDVVTYSLPNQVATVAVAAAIWRIGAIASPVVTLYREHEFAFILGQLRPAAVISSADVRGRNLCAELDDALRASGWTPQARIVRGTHPGWTTLAEPGDPTHLPGEVVPRGPHEPCLVLYTSGTTSEPKGVLHTSSALVHEVATMQREWGLTFRDRMLMASPLTHITGLLQGLLVPCLVGAGAILLDRWDPDACVAAIEDERATYMAGATPFLRGLLEAYGRRGGRPVLRQFCSGGAAVPPHLIEEAEALRIVAYRCWGMTELPTATLAGERDSLLLRSTTDGRRADGVEVEAVGENRRVLAPGKVGELRVRGPERMVGHVDPSHNDEALDAAGWLYSGDLGSVDVDGWVRIAGRLKDVINRGGEKLSAREIEDLLSQHPAVADVAVVPLPDERLGEQVGAVLVARGERPDDDKLREFLRGRRIAVQKIPARMEWVEALPRTASGKVRKHELIERLEAEWARPRSS